MKKELYKISKSLETISDLSSARSVEDTLRDVIRELQELFIILIKEKEK